MTPQEAVHEIENTYDKQLTQFQTVRYCRFLAKFTLDDIDKIVEKAVEETRMMPRIANLNDAARDLLILRPDRRTKADKGCTICDGTGWEYVTVTYRETGQEVQAVERCSCRSDPGPAGPPGEVVPF